MNIAATSPGRLPRHGNFTLSPKSSQGIDTVGKRGMKLAYIAGPYRAPTEHGVKMNIRRAEDVATELWKQGYATLCPQLNSAFLGGIVPDEVFLEGTMEMMRRADVVFMMQGWQKSRGAVAEHAEALRLGKEIIYDSDF